MAIVTVACGLFVPSLLSSVEISESEAKDFFDETESFVDGTEGFVDGIEGFVDGIEGFFDEVKLSIK
jgi:hypothetical protein